MPIMLEPDGSEHITPEDDWSDAPHRVDSVQFTHRGKHFYQVTVTTDAPRVVVSVSPQGRSVRVWLDGIPMQEEPAELGRDPASRLDCFVAGTNDLVKETGIQATPDRRYLVPWLMQVVLAAWKLLARTPVRARRSMFGVLSSVLPAQPRWSARCWSVTISSTLGVLFVMGPAFSRQ